MLPFLEILGDGHVHAVPEIRSLLADRFDLTPEERSRQSLVVLFNKRVTWAGSSLRNAGLVDHPSPGLIRITPQGLVELSQCPDRIDNDYLRRFPGFVVFNRGKVSLNEHDAEPAIEPTPFEQLDASFQVLQTQLARELLDQVQASSPAFFEKLVVDLLVAMGYGGSRDDAGTAIGQSSDGGIDGFIKEDRLGLDIIYIQAKRWQNTVGRPEIQGFVGSLAGKKARKGVFITTSRFTKNAEDYASSLETKVILIDGVRLTELMIEYGVGVADLQTYTLKKIDSDYFS